MASQTEQRIFLVARLSDQGSEQEMNSKIIRIIAKASFEPQWEIVALAVETLLNEHWDNISFKISYPKVKRK